MSFALTKPLQETGELQRKVRNILTLRYDPRGATLLPNLSWQDFLEYEGISSIVEPLLENAIRKIVGHAKHVSMGISGGVDTSTVLALTRRCFPDLSIRTFCLSFGKDQQECKDADHVAGLYGTKHEEVVVENPFEKLAEQIRIVGEPRWNLYTAYIFEKVAQDGCELLLTGDGGDELFGGYNFRYQQALMSTAFGPVEYLNAHERDWVPDQAELIPNLCWKDIYAYLSKYLDVPLPLLGRIFLADFNGKFLYDFLPTNTAFSRYFGVRAESPFLQREVIHIASHLPYRLKYDPINKIGKLMLRNILFLHSGIQPAVRSKVGFGMDLAWMWDNHVREICKSHFRRSKLHLVGVNDGWLPCGFKKADEHDLRCICKMFGLLAVQLWLEQDMPTRNWSP